MRKIVKLIKIRTRATSVRKIQIKIFNYYECLKKYIIDTTQKKTFQDLFKHEILHRYSEYLTLSSIQTLKSGFKFKKFKIVHDQSID